jgi:hypothetical protein
MEDRNRGEGRDGEEGNINVAVPGEVVAMVLVDWLGLREQLVAWRVCRLWHRLLSPHFQRHVRNGKVSYTNNFKYFGEYNIVAKSFIQNCKYHLKK